MDFATIHSVKRQAKAGCHRSEAQVAVMRHVRAYSSTQVRKTFAYITSTPMAKTTKETREELRTKKHPPFFQGFSDDFPRKVFSDEPHLNQQPLNGHGLGSGNII